MQMFRRNIPTLPTAGCSIDLRDSAEFNGWRTAVIIDMLEFKLLEPAGKDKYMS